MNRSRGFNHAAVATGQRPQATAPTTSHWREALPDLVGTLGTARPVQLGDAPALLTMLATPEVSRYIPPPPTTIEGFERFIAWSTHEQAEGRAACFTVVPHGLVSAVGLFQIRGLDWGSAPRSGVLLSGPRSGARGSSSTSPA